MGVVVICVMAQVAPVVPAERLSDWPA